MRSKKIGKGIIVFLLIGLSSCSALRRGGESVPETGSAGRNSRLLYDVSKNNISDNSFRFDRVRVFYSFDGDQKRFSGNIKYDSSGKVLFSIRTIGGIEVARLYADSEKVIVIDRINRMYMEGNTEKLFEKYGLSWTDREIIFGDIPQKLTFAVRARCTGNRAEIPVIIENRNINLVIDCNEKKISDIEIVEEGLDNTFRANFRDYTVIGEDIFPGTVVIKDRKELLNLEVSFGRYSRLEGIIEVPEMPSGYDKGRLL